MPYTEQQQAIVYIPSHHQTLELANRLYRKECIPIGDYTKKTKNEEIKFSVDEPLIDHWVETFKQMQYNGISVPMPKNHTEDPEENRGHVIYLEKDINEAGIPALFCTFKFRDDEAEKNLKDADVSIYVPPEFTDAYGNEYKRPITHIAFTNHPVIPKLGKMQPIAASYSEQKPTSKKEKKMPFPPKKQNEKQDDDDLEEEKDHAEEGEVDYKQEVKEIAEKMGIDTEKVPEDKWCDAINHVLDMVMSDEDEDEDEDADADEDEDKKEKGHLAREVHAKEYHPPQGKEGMPPAPIAAGFLSIARKSRLAELNELVSHSRITPAVRDKLARKYCNDEALSLAFTPEGEVFDDFDEIVEALKDNDPVKLNKETTKRQDDLSLSFSQVNANNNPLLKNAESRAKAAGQS